MAIALSVLGGLLAGRAAQAQSIGPTGAPTGITVNAIVGSPQAYVGRTVTVTGEVENVLGARAFMMENRALGLDEQVLVLSPRALEQVPGWPATEAQLTNSPARVRGVVRLFDLAAIEAELRADLDDSLVLQWAGRPAIVAREISLSPEVLDTTIDMILDHPDAFVGGAVVVTAEVGAAVGQQAFTLQDDDLLYEDELLAVAARPLSAVPRWPSETASLGDREIEVRGTVRTFDLATIEADLGVDLEDGLFTSWAGRPVLVATTIDLEPQRVGVPADVILDNTDAFIGHAVTVRGELAEVIGQRAFVVEDDDFLLDDNLLVVTDRPLSAVPGWPAAVVDATPTALATDPVVLVRGTVRRFDVAAVESELGIDLEDGLFARWAGRTVLVARASGVSYRPGPATLSPAGPVRPAPAATTGAGATPGAGR